MTYTETLDFLYSQLPMYQRQGKSAFKKDLTNIIALCEHLDHPQNTFDSIHIAGTNGKGSSSHMLASILQTEGYKTGLYTSPHLLDFRERIKINGKCISEAEVITFVKKIEPLLTKIEASFFEITVAMAFDHFATNGVELAVIETGLGGRLDSTNIIYPLLSLITNIGYDHMDMLGDTLEKIAFEKAGIIKESTDVVVSEYQEEIAHVFRNRSKEVNAPLSFSYELVDEQKLPETDLKGLCQPLNVRGVVAACHQLQSLGLHISDLAIEEGLNNVIRNTGLHGRYQLMINAPLTICDTAHNAEGLSQVIEQIQNEQISDLHIVFGAVQGKELDKVIELLPASANYYLCEASVPRALSIEILSEKFESNGFKYHTSTTVGEAYELAKLNASENDGIFVGGSTFVVADFLKYYGFSTCS